MPNGHDGYNPDWCKFLHDKIDEKIENLATQTDKKLAAMAEEQKLARKRFDAIILLLVGNAAGIVATLVIMLIGKLGG
jgi:CHASE3 domain sensor protein